MVVREIAYVWLSVLILSCRRSHGDVGNLLHDAGGERTFRQDFLSKSYNNKTKGWIWNKGFGSYSICKDQQSMLVTEELNTTNIKEVLLEVEFAKQHHNKSLISVVLITAAGGKKVFNVTGYNKGKTGRLRAALFLQLNSPQSRFAFQSLDDENCVIVYSPNITYNYCPGKTIDLAHFPRTNSPSNGSLVVKVEGICSNALGHRKPFAYCASNGSWSYNETIPCGCQAGLIRTSSGCIKLTYEIQDLEATRLSNSRAVLSWKTQQDVHYSVYCKKRPQCNSDCSRVQFCATLQNGSPAKRGNKQSNVSGLEQGKCYLFIVVATITVVALNNSVKIETWNKMVTAKELPGKVRNIQGIKLQEHNHVVLSWLPPINFSATNVSYKVTCQIYCITPNCSKGCSNLQFIPSSDNLLQTNVTVKGFGVGNAEQYLFTVFTKDRFHDFSEGRGPPEWNFKTINYTVETRTNITSSSKKFNVVDVIIGVSVLVLAVIVTFVATKCYNRWKTRKRNLTTDEENQDHLFNCEVPLESRSNSHYVDPANYENVKNLLRQFTKKLNEKNLKVYENIGEGEFGVVWKGYLENPGEERVVVAVKSLRSGLSPKLRRDFLTEASVMGQFNDPNVISLYGVVVKKNTVKIVMEYMSNGSLDQYLLKNNGRLTTLQLLGMARGIASGMNYLSGRKFIHRDLAARNILVDSNLCCKVSDFGLSREIFTTTNYETRGGKIPIRWTAPEVIKHKKSFIASDVWSFGVVLWEIVSFGQRPYWEWDNFQVLQEIESGYRLPAPLKCPKSVHSLMLDCWEKERTKRPLFSYIVDRLDEWIRSPEMINQSPALAKRKDEVVVVDSQSPIQQWLNSIKMGKYVSNFSEAGYCNISQVANLTEEDLMAMGIKLVGHRHKIYQSIPLVAKSNSENSQFVNH